MAGRRFQKLVACAVGLWQTDYRPHGFGGPTRPVGLASRMIIGSGAAVPLAPDQA
jgi:hypothetical protein